MNDWEWLFLDGADARLFRLGDLVVAGQLVGSSVGGAPVHAQRGGRVAAIECDIDRDEVVLAIVPGEPPSTRFSRRSRRQIDRRPLPRKTGTPPRLWLLGRRAAT